MGLVKADILGPLPIFFFFLFFFFLFLARLFVAFRRIRLRLFLIVLFGLFGLFRMISLPLLFAPGFCGSGRPIFFRSHRRRIYFLAMLWPVRGAVFACRFRLNSWLVRRRL